MQESTPIFGAKTPREGSFPGLSLFRTPSISNGSPLALLVLYSRRSAPPREMQPPTASGDDEAPKVPRRGLTDIHVASVDDSRNVLAGLDYEDRITIVFAAGAVMERFVPDTDDRQLRQGYFAWVGLTMLLELAAKTRARWGEGPPGMAKPSRPRTPVADGEVLAQRVPRHLRKARHPDNLLLNLLQPDFVLPQFQAANYPVAIRAVRDELFGQWYSRGVFVPTLRLSLDIVMELHRLAGLPHGPDEATQARRMLASHRALAVPGVKVPVNARTIALVLEYYGVATPARTASCNGYRVRPWQLRRLMGMWTDHRIISLTDLTWMQGRYFLGGTPIQSAADSPDGPGVP